MLFIREIFNEAQLAEIRSNLGKLSWDDGSKTALGTAKKIKDNLQITSSTSDDGATLLKLMHKIIQKNLAFQQATLPKALED